MDIKEIYDLFRKSGSITTDSRQIGEGTMFFALKGATFDGNTFVAEAFTKGASYCVIDNPQYRISDRCILVDNVLQTMQQLATYHRRQFHIPVLAITGTNGKTTTKELVTAVLRKRYRTHATQGNFNNHLGVPITLLTMPLDTQIAVVEMGANHPGEIDFLCHITEPDFGLITNVGKAHLEGFGSFEGVINTKTELYRYLAGKGGQVFVNADDEILMQHSQSLHRVTYGQAADADAKGSYVGANPYMKFYFENGDNVYSVQTNLLGGYNLANAMAAVCVGKHFGVELFDIKEALEAYTPTNSRSQFKQTERNKLFLDCYNANPSSMKAAVENFGNMHCQNAVVMLGGMKELGPTSEQEHRNVVEMAQSFGFSKMVFVGEEFAFVKGLADNVLWFATSQDAKQYFADNPLNDCTILIKGSNSTKMGILEDSL